MVEKNHHAGIHTGFGCKVDEDMHGGPGGSILTAWYECMDMKQAAETALELLDTNYEVTVFSNGYYNPRSYRNKKDVVRDFGPWLDGTARVPLFRFELAFDGEEQGIGLLQGWSDVLRHGEEPGGLLAAFDGLPAPELESPDGSAIVFWFTQAGMNMFHEGLSMIIRTVTEHSPWSVIMSRNEASRETLDAALYRDGYQIAWSRTDVLELDDLDQEYIEITSPPARPA